MPTSFTSGKFQALDANGTPLAGGLVYTYAAGTLTPLATYTTYGLTQPNTNPVVLDERGEAAIWFTDATYRVIVRTAADVTLYDTDNLNRLSANNLAFSYSGTYSAGSVGKWLQDLALSTGAEFIGSIGSAASTVLRTVQDKQRDIVSIFDWLTVAQRTDVRTRAGAIGVALAAAINTAIPAAVAAGATDIWFPSGSYVINNTDGVKSVAPITLRGGGPQKTIIRQTNAAGKGVDFAYPSLLQGGGIFGMTVEAGAGWQTGAFTGSGSTAVGIEVSNANNLFRADDIAINNFDYSVSVKGCFGTHWTNCRALFFTNRGLQVEKSTVGIGADNLFIGWKISNFNFSGTNTASRCVDIVNSGGDTFYSIRATSAANAFVVAPGATDQVLYCHFTDCFGDTCINDNWVFDGTNGKVWENTCTACWGAYSTDGSGLYTTGSNLKGFQWAGGQLRENGLSGWTHGGGTSVSIDTTRIVHNSKKTSNTSPGVDIAGGVTDFSIRGCRIGNDGTSTFVQANGIEIDSGLSERFVIDGNDLTSPGSGKVPIVNGSSLLNWMISNNLPLQTVGCNSSDAIPMTGRLASASAGATTSLGITLAARSSVLAEFYVKAGAAPGGAQTFTYTVYVNGSSTSMTGVISGASDTAVTVLTNPQVITKQDEVELRVTTSAGAAVTTHTFYMLQEP